MAASGPPGGQKACIATGTPGMQLGVLGAPCKSAITCAFSSRMDQGACAGHLGVLRAPWIGVMCLSHHFSAGTLCCGLCSGPYKPLSWVFQGSLNLQRKRRKKRSYTTYDAGRQLVQVEM